MADLTELQSSQSVKIAGADSSGVETNFVNASSNGDLNVVAGIRSGGVFGSLNLASIGTSYEAKVGGSRLSNRKVITIFALDGNVYWGYDNTVTTSNGTILFKNQMITFDVNPNDTNFQIWLTAPNSGTHVRITECP